jgi:hemerythrin-like domain-containing protein
MNYFLLCTFLGGTIIAGSSESIGEMSAVEDLMREHGLLARILLIYEKEAESVLSLNVAVLKDAARIIQSFIEEYHEKLEEEYIFPVLAQDADMKKLVETLKAQHKRGREITKAIIQLCGCNQTRHIKKQIQSLLKGFTRMYRMHAAREDTVAFPAFKKHLSSSELEKLGDSFEAVEKIIFPNGFDGVLQQVAQLERNLDIYHLAKFTPKQPAKVRCINVKKVPPSAMIS